MDFFYGKLTGADVSTGFVALKRRFIKFFQEYVSAIISIELTSISVGLHSSGSIGIGLHSGCPCMGGYVAASFWIKGNYLVVPQPLWVQLGL